MNWPADAFPAASCHHRQPPPVHLPASAARLSGLPLPSYTRFWPKSCADKRKFFYRPTGAGGPQSAHSPNIHSGSPPEPSSCLCCYMTVSADKCVLMATRSQKGGRRYAGQHSTPIAMRADCPPARTGPIWMWGGRSVSEFVPLPEYGPLQPWSSATPGWLVPTTHLINLCAEYP